ncbi:hypothetical protein AWJ20_3715 [Sugiyamaella lignohabitans]|uniref:PEX18/PEX21 C-terminal domain-containing protein n=1 Tax=Sugiyamaella lignohabitans TaxID=796027 RepID=A0A167BWQ3_9ASCO|nr:uncharacterized protein AWJ20_3715 [Sugiyamaella lignohabitans]ANB10921.1 hypothetical protein AWJ20_3715 [Sugiyamaella lignohabitans]
MSQLFSSSDSCGPVNPLQNLGKHTGPTNSSQHERFVRENSAGPSSFRSTPSPSLVNGTNTDFQAFASRGSPSQSGFNFHPGQGQAASQVPGQLPGQLPVQLARNGAPLDQRNIGFQAPQTTSSDWASEFSKLSVGSRPSQDLRMATSPLSMTAASSSYQQYQPQQPMLRSDLMYYQTSASVSQQPEHHQIHKLNEEQASFENAFAEVERSLNSESISQQDTTIQKETEQVESLQKVNNTELSGVAQDIINSINESSQSTNSSTASKMKSSNFMALMDQLSKKNVVLEGTKFVDGVSGAEISADQLARQEDTANYKEPSLPEHLQPQNMSKAPQIPLQDPFSFINQLNIDPSKSTPFELAQLMSPGVALSDWEEKYEEDPDWTQ